ncbi:Oidioi.mRNA.OKI2018_I69.chr1.g1675.t1.cds [Oikopleura dioica]|uniref:Oidioi.mRNA.OKI2018_I69.chr1.g1675.t1.cds n=1 Tax=Oikopleura dioica TaxID=34765 RepID=A0ABN7SP59_OIKDI|nr:Oidioi.mRNA.OKI2018_I69.chr1.g1675.t1.cds [Oikopleura dioica]
MRLILPFLALASAVYIDGKWVPKCFKNSCAMGRTKCCPTYNQVAEIAKESEQGPEAVPYDYEEEMAQGPVIMPAPQVRVFNIKDWFGNLMAESGNNLRPKNWIKKIFSLFQRKFMPDFVRPQFSIRIGAKLFEKVADLLNNDLEDFESLKEKLGKEMAELLIRLKDDLEDVMVILTSNLDFDKDVTIANFKEDVIDVVIDLLEDQLGPDSSRPIKEVLNEAKKRIFKILDEAIEEASVVLFDEVVELIEKMTYDDGFSVESPKDILLLDLLRALELTFDPNGDLKPAQFMKLVKKSVSKFLKDFGKMEIIDKIMLIIDRLSASDKPFHQAYEAFLEGVMDVLGENGTFNDVIHDFKAWVQSFFSIQNRFEK